MGDSVEVVGTAGEAFGVTQITPGSTGTVTPIAGAPTRRPAAQAPGSDCAVGAYPTATERAAREAREGELFDLDGPFTVTNTFSLTNGANATPRSASPPDTTRWCSRPRSRTPRPATSRP